MGFLGVEGRGARRREARVARPDAAPDTNREGGASDMSHGKGVPVRGRGRGAAPCPEAASEEGGVAGAGGVGRHGKWSRRRRNLQGERGAA